LLHGLGLGVDHFQELADPGVLKQKSQNQGQFKERKSRGQGQGQGRKERVIVVQRMQEIKNYNVNPMVRN